jgi:hypothetical protein
VAFLPVTDFVTVVSVPQMAKLADIGRQGVPLPASQTVFIEHVLDRADGVIEIAPVEMAVIPVSREVAEIVLGVVEAVAVAWVEIPDGIAMVQVLMHVVDEGVH